MHFLRVLGLVLCCGYGVTSHAATPTDYVLNADNNTLSALVDGKKQLVTKDEALLSIVKTADFDQDGSKDVLFYTSTGGNCCPNTYQLATYRDGKFVMSELPDAWDDPEIHEQDGQTVFTFFSNNEGINDDDYQGTVSLYTVKNGKAELLEMREDKAIPAVVEYHSKQFPQEQRESSESVRLFQYDLDGDGKTDDINGIYWSRWGRMLIDMQFGNGTKVEPNDFNCKRVGVLDNLHNGVKDLVCDASDQYHWNGTTYQVQPNPLKQTFD